MRGKALAATSDLPLLPTEDILALIERLNISGTINEQPNGHWLLSAAATSLPPLFNRGVDLHVFARRAK